MATKKKQPVEYTPIVQSWFQRQKNKIMFWWYEGDIELLIDTFQNNRYPHTGMALRPEDLHKWAIIMKWKPKRLKRVMDICIMHDIIRDQPASKVKGSKQFYYILNPQFLK